MPRYISDGAERGSTNLTRTFRDVVGHGEYLFGLLIEQQVVVAEVTTGYVPVETFGLQKETENVGEQRPQSDRDFGDCVIALIGRNYSSFCFLL